MSKDDTIVSDTLFSLCFITGGEKESLKFIAGSIDLKAITTLMLRENLLIKAPALRIIGNFCTGSIEFVDLVLKSNGIAALQQILMTSTQNIILREACWTLSNIAASTQEHIEKLIVAETIFIVIHLIERVEDFSVKKEGIWTIANACVIGNPTQVMQIIKYGALSPLVSTLKTTDTELLFMILNAINHIFESGKLEGREKEISNLFESIGGRKELDELTHHQNPDVYKRVITIIESLYQIQDSAQIENQFMQN